MSNVIKIFAKNKEKNLSFLYAALFPFLLFITLEMINTTTETVKFASDLSFPVIIVSGFALLMLMALLFCVIGNLFVSALLLTAMATFFYIFSYYRLVLTGSVFVASDLSLLTQAKNLRGFAKISYFPAPFIVGFIAAFLLVPLFFASKHIKMSGRKRMASLSGFLAVVLSVYFTPFTKLNVLPKFNIDITVNLPSNEIYQKNGVLMGFYTNYFYQGDVLPGYSEAYMQEQVDKILENITPHTSSDVKPNVIVIMSEAFVDPYIFNGVEYSSDPMEYLRGMENVTRGSVISPVFGGGTCNTEFEFLTGNAMIFTGYDIKVNEMENTYFPKNDLRALPYLFKNNGYTTVSVHTFFGEFFNRNTIHPKLGFDRSVFPENMTDPVYKGPYISDEYFTDTVLDIINSTDEPLFLYGITMQNHYNYSKDKYDEYDVEVTGGIEDDELRLSTNSYIQGVYDADLQLKRLIEELEQSDRPTIVVFFGDHLPLVGKSAYELYTATGNIPSGTVSEWSVEQTQQMFSTPYVVWNNYGMPVEEWGDISPYFLGALTAQAAGLNLNLYYEFLLDTYESYHAYTEYLFIDAEGYTSKEPTDGLYKDVKLFYDFQYDKFKGVGYVDGLLAEMMPLE